MCDNSARAIITTPDGKTWLGARPRFFLVSHHNTHPGDLRLIFGDGAVVETLPEGSTMLDLLVLVGVFSSKGNARKNWQGQVELPVGTISLTVGKKHKVDLVVHRPPADLPAWEGADVG